MTRMTVTVEDALVESARFALGARTKAETIRRALEEVVRRQRLAAALTHQGEIDLEIDNEELATMRARG
jgi:hypothetical protein